MSDVKSRLKTILRHPLLFCEVASGLRLRQYQRAVAAAVIESCIHSLGLSFVVMLPRQSGKNELQAQIETYLLTVFQQEPQEMVKISPTWKPQSLNAMRRLERTLNRNVFTRGQWKKEQGYIYRLGSSRIYFLSGAPEANIVGATASLLLEVDEAQDVGIQKYDKDIAPMAASTNATRVFWGTAWTSQTLLARELRAAREAERKDGIRRTFVLGADQVGQEVPAYRAFVQEQIARLGRSHPMVRTQFFSEEIDSEGGLFPPARIALMLGNHAAQLAPIPGQQTAFLLDVAGADEAASDPLTRPALSGARDSTVLTVVHVDTEASQPLPTYRVLARFAWVGESQPKLFTIIKSLAEAWKPRFVVCDATGLGAGLTAFLDRSVPTSVKVIPFVFNASTKSKLGWDFLAIVDTGRWKEPALDYDTAKRLNLPQLPGALPGPGHYAYTDLFVQQLQACQYEVVPGPAHQLKWGVPDGRRDPNGEGFIHDDLVISAALSAVLDQQDWSTSGPALIVPRNDPLEELDQGF